MATKSQFTVVNQSVSNPESVLLLIGTALDGPVEVPFFLNEQYGAEDVIGRSPLSKAYIAARKTGQSRIMMYRLNGTHAEATLTYDGDFLADVMKFRSVAASDLYNEIKIDCGPEKMTVTGTDGSTRHYFFSSYPTGEMLVDAINLDAEFGLIEFTASILTEGFQMHYFDENHPVTVFFEGGDSEEELIPNRNGTGDYSSILLTLKDRLNVALFGENPDDQANYSANSLLAILDYGVICLADMFHDDGVDFTNMLARFCAAKSTELNSGTIGVIGVRPLFEITEATIADKFSALMGAAPTNLPASVADGTTVVEDSTSTASHYSYVQIVVGDTASPAFFSQAIDPVSMAYSYAALQAYLPISTSMTNKGFIGLAKVNYEFSKENIDSLLANGYISIVSSIRRGIVPYQAITAVGKKANSLLRNPTVVRVSHVVTKRITDFLDVFIGEATTPTSRANLDSGLYNVLKALVEEEKLISDYTLEVDYLNYTTEVSVKISYVPLSYIDTVSTTVEMPFNREVII